MELKSNQLGAWTKNSPPSAMADMSACLVYGPDTGGITDLCLSLVGTSDRVTLEGNEITAQNISGHTDTLSLFGGGTTVLVRGATDKHLKEFEPILAAGLNPGSRLIVQAGALKGTSKLKKLFANNKEAASVALYTMRGREISDFVAGCCAELGYKIDRNASSLLQTEMSGDRALTARAAEVLCLHAEGSGRKKITREDVLAACHSVNESDLSAPIDFALQGNLADALTCLDDKLLSGENPIALMRIFSHRVNRFHTLASSGRSPADAVEKAKPPIFWTDKDRFKRILTRHDHLALKKVLVLIDRTEDRIVEDGVKASIALPDLLVTLSKGQIKWPKF